MNKWLRPAGEVAALLEDVAALLEDVAAPLGNSFALYVYAGLRKIHSDFRNMKPVIKKLNIAC